MAPGLPVRSQPRRERGEVLPPHPARPERDRVPQPAEARVGRLPRGLLPPAPHGQAADGRARRGPHVPVGLPVERGLGAAAARPGRAGPRDRGRVPRHLRRRALLHRGAGPRHRRPAQDPAPAVRPRPRPRHPGRRHERPALHPEGGREAARRAAVHPAAEGADRPEAAEVRLRRVLPEERRGDAARLRRGARGLRPHARDRRERRARPRLRRPRARRPAVPPAAVRDPAGPRPRHVPAPARRRRRRRALRRHHARDPRAHRPRARRDHEHGLRGVLPHRVGPDPPRARAGHPRRAGPRVGGGLGRELRVAHHRPRPAALRAAVRAVPEPRAHPDARHRHGLRRAPP